MGLGLRFFDRCVLGQRPLVGLRIIIGLGRWLLGIGGAMSVLAGYAGLL
jgi:hypothetical protein